MSEAQLQRGVITLARTLGWEMIYHTRYSVGCDRGSKGFPDLVMIRPVSSGWGGLRPARMIVVELKGPRGRLTPEQMVWLDAFRELPGVGVYVWTPADLDEGGPDGSLAYRVLR